MLKTLLMTSAFAQSPPVQADLHLDTPTQILTKKLGLDAPTGLEAGLSQLRAGGTNLVVEVLWPPRKVQWRRRTFALLETMEREVGRLEEFTLVRSPDEARKIAAAGGIGVIFSLEGAHGIQGENWRSDLDDLHRRGLSLLGLTWSFSNDFAGSSGDGGGGLTDLGREFVRVIREKRIGLDVSHASRQTTMAVCTDSPVPVIASHSDAHALSRQKRNLTDEEIRCIAATGGVVGLNFHAPFVGAGASVAKVADHADHIAKVGGYGAVALGSDFDGFIRNPVGLADAGDLGALWAELKRRGWTDDQIAGVRGENFLRAWQGILAGG